jgi:ubiquitin conjugation factor E4 B
LVNAGAAALRPDASKVSNTNLLLNMSVILLKLCEPFVDDEKKQHLIAPGFVSSEQHHGGVFAVSGDDSVKRLGDSDGGHSVLTAPYHPKNSFIPQCFFFCARSLHLGVVQLLSQHENLLRHIGHYHWQLQSQNRDIHSDPRFSTLIARERSDEVALFQDDMMESTLQFCNFQAKVLFDMDDATLRTMPEDFVSDICDVLLGVANQKPKLLGGLQFRYAFKLVVKLLSAKYASVRYFVPKLSLSSLIAVNVEVSHLAAFHAYRWFETTTCELSLEMYFTNYSCRGLAAIVEKFRLL